MSRAVKTAFISIGVILVIALLAAIGWAWSRTGYWYMGHRMMGGFGGGLFMGLGMLLVGLLVIWGVVILIRGNSDSQTHHSESAFDILKRRYASGELTKEEFEQKKKDLLS
jgi:putative membrane protein